MAEGNSGVRRYCADPNCYHEWGKFDKFCPRIGCDSTQCITEDWNDSSLLIPAEHPHPTNYDNCPAQAVYA